MLVNVLNAAGRLRPIHLALVGCIIFVAGSAQAASELQRLEATIPPRAKLSFASYQSCALITGIDKRNDGANFRDIEAAIAAACKKNLTEADRDLAAAGLNAAERAKFIE